MELKQYIEEKGLTQGKAADNIGISRQYLCAILAKKVIPGRGVAFKITKWSQDIVRLKDLWEI